MWWNTHKRLLTRCIVCNAGLAIAKPYVHPLNACIVTKRKHLAKKSSPWPLNFMVDRVSRGYSNWTIRGWYMDNLANFCPQLCHAVTLTFGSLTLKICARSGVMWSNYVPNFIEIQQSADEGKNRFETIFFHHH